VPTEGDVDIGGSWRHWIFESKKWGDETPDFELCWKPWSLENPAAGLPGGNQINRFAPACDKDAANL